MIEELARVCGSTSLMLAINGLSTTPIINWASEELKQQYLTRMATGELQGSYCLSEADAGSDAAAMKTRARREGDSYVLNGSKHWITNAGISDVYVVFAKTDPSAGARGVSCFLVERAMASRSASSSPRWACGAAPRRGASSTTSSSPRPT